MNSPPCGKVNRQTVLFTIGLAAWAGGEIEYTLGLGPSAARREGASPSLPTKQMRTT